MAEDKQPLDGKLDVRVNSQELEIFIAKSARVTGKPHQVFLREIINAFNEGRLRIDPSFDKDEHGKLYK